MKKERSTGSPCDLRSCFFCQLCLKEWLPAVDAHRKEVRYRKGGLIFLEGDPVTGLYFLNNGTAKVHQKWSGDRELIIRIAGSGDILGHRGLGKDLRYPVSATALEPSAACYVELDFFYTTLKVNPELTFQLLLFFAEELKRSERKMRNLAHMSVKGRIAGSFLTLAERFGRSRDGVLGIVLSRQDIASYAGTTYETAFRMMSELADSGWIAMEGKSLVLKDMAALAALAAEGD